MAKLCRLRPPSKRRVHHRRPAHRQALRRVALHLERAFLQAGSRDGSRHPRRKRACSNPRRRQLRCYPQGRSRNHSLHPSPVLLLPEPRSRSPSHRPPVPRVAYRSRVPPYHRVLLVVSGVHSLWKHDFRATLRLHLPRFRRAQEVRAGVPRVPYPPAPVHRRRDRQRCQHLHQDQLQPSYQGARVGCAA